MSCREPKMTLPHKLRASHQREYDELRRKASRSDIVPPSVTNMTTGMASMCSSRYVAFTMAKRAAPSVRIDHGFATIVVAPTLREEIVLDHVPVL